MRYGRRRGLTEQKKEACRLQRGYEKVIRAQYVYNTLHKCMDCQKLNKMFQNHKHIVI